MQSNLTVFSEFIIKFQDVDIETFSDYECLKEGIDYKGYDIAGYSYMLVSGLGDCVQRCVEHTSCIGIVYGYSQSNCFFKSRNYGELAAIGEGYISGNMDCLHGQYTLFN